MVELGESAAGRFCWVDLAASDAGGAKLFYRQMFGWTSHEHAANGGGFTLLRLADRDVGSVYQLRQAHLDQGVPSHWTPYVRVDQVDDAVARALSIGGTVIVRPFVVCGVARLALIADSIGAALGLWEPLAVTNKEKAHD